MKLRKCKDISIGATLITDRNSVKWVKVSDYTWRCIDPGSSDWKIGNIYTDNEGDYIGKTDIIIDFQTYLKQIEDAQS